MSSSQMNWDMGAEQHHTNPFVVIHRHLRGKYILVIVLGLLFGVVGGSMGYMSRKPMYASTGIIRIKPELPKVLFESEQSTAPRMFTSFVNTQAQLVSSVEVIRLAMESDPIKKLEMERGIFFDDLERVQDRLRVRTDTRAQEIIRVSYEHTDPVVSQAIVSAVLNAYIQRHGKEGSIKDPDVINVLRDRRNQLQSIIDRKSSRISEIMREYNTENLDPLIEDTSMTVRSLEREKALLTGYLSDFSQEGGEASNVPQTAEEASRGDTRMRTLIEQRDALIENRTQMMVAEGLREEHRDVRRVTMMIDNIQKTIDERLEQLQTGEGLVLYDEEGNRVSNEEELREQRAEVDNELSRAKERAKIVFEASLELNQLREEKAQGLESLMQVEQRLTMIETESKLEESNSVGGKINIAQSATLARAPTSDPRIKMAAAGFVGLGSVPVVIILVLGYLSHRVNYSDDEVLTGAQAGIVGMLPDLGNSLEDQELASASAFAVHQIRSQLQIKNADEGACVYGVTSPAPGDGKTSLIIAMGLSFAESGSRTLLLDLDFIGRGLSVHFGHSRAPSLADRLGEKEEVAELVQETEFPGLSILPAGYGDDLRVSKLSPKSVQALLGPLKEQFDTILIDTGPILGSVEAAFVSPQADGVLLVVGRGQYKPLIKKAIDQIHAVDGTIAATIFNRASMHEIRHSTSSMSVHFSRQFSRQQQEIEQATSSRGGPVAGTLFADRRSSSSEPNYRKAEP